MRPLLVVFCSGCGLLIALCVVLVERENRHGYEQSFAPIPAQCNVEANLAHALESPLPFENDWRDIDYIHFGRLFISMILHVVDLSAQDSVCNILNELDRFGEKSFVRENPDTRILSCKAESLNDNGKPTINAEDFLARSEDIASRLGKGCEDRQDRHLRAEAVSKYAEHVIKWTLGHLSSETNIEAYLRACFDCGTQVPYIMILWERALEKAPYLFETLEKYDVKILRSYLVKPTSPERFYTFYEELYKRESLHMSHSHISAKGIGPFLLLFVSSMNQFGRYATVKNPYLHMIKMEIRLSLEKFAGCGKACLFLLHSSLNNVETEEHYESLTKFLSCMKHGSLQEFAALDAVPDYETCVL